MVMPGTPGRCREFIPASRAGGITGFCLFMAYRAELHVFPSVRDRRLDAVSGCHIHSPLPPRLKISGIAEVTAYNFRIPLWNPDHKGNTMELSEPDLPGLSHKGKVTIRLKGWNTNIRYIKNQSKLSRQVIDL